MAALDGFLPIVYRPREAPVLGILGKRGYGKTTLAREVVGGHARVFVVDPLGEFDVADVFTDGAAAAEHIRAHPSPRVLRASLRSQTVDDFDLVVEALVETEGDVVLVVDELSLYCRNHIPTPRLDWVLRYGRHIDIALVWTSRRPAEVPRLATGQAERLYVFRTDEPGDLDALRGRLGPQKLERVQSLEKFAYVTTE